MKYNYYKEWHLKWVRTFNRLIRIHYRSLKLERLIEDVKHFFWKLEWRMLCYKWYGDEAKNSSFWPASLK